MHFFGVVFILYTLKLSAGKGFWFNLRVTDHEVYKLAIKLERLEKKYQKCKLDIDFLSKCRDTNINPNFTQLKQLKEMDRKMRFKFCRKLLFNEISCKHKRLKSLKKNIDVVQTELLNSSTWLKRKCITYSINYVLSRFSDDVTKRHKRKYENLLNVKYKKEGIQNNPNNIIWNLSSRNLSNEEYDVLLFGLSHGIATKCSTKDVIPAVEAIWDQLQRNNLIKSNYHSVTRAKNCLRAFAYNLIDFDDYFPVHP